MPGMHKIQGFQRFMDGNHVALYWTGMCQIKKKSHCDYIRQAGTELYCVISYTQF